MSDLRSRLHKAELQHDSDTSVITNLKSELGALAELDQSLRAAAARESEVGMRQETESGTERRA